MITSPHLQSALDELYSERTSLEQELQQIKTVIDGLEALVQRSKRAVTPQPATQSTRYTGPTQSVRAAIDMILRNADGSVTLIEIKQRVKNAIPPVSVENFDNAIYATLSRGKSQGSYVKEDGKYRWPKPEMRFTTSP